MSADKKKRVSTDFDGEGSIKSLPIQRVAFYERSQLWRWGFRILAVALPLVFLLVLEIGLRLVGYGHSAAFTEKMEMAGCLCHVPNNAFGLRYFPEDIAREANWFSYPIEKDTETIRIFVLGGSAAMGDPEPTYGLARQLQVLLEVRYAGRDFEVINAAMTAINSHVVRDIAAEVVEHDADLLVIYLGNNEVVGPFGASNPLLPLSDSLGLIRASLWLKGTRFGQLVQELARIMSPEGSREQNWQGMELFLDHEVAADDSRLTTVYDHFRRNLKAILADAQKAEVPVLLSTVGVNLADCPPFASQHDAALDAAKLEEWENFYQRGIGLQTAGALSAALESYQQALAIGDGYAELHFRIGRCLFELGRKDEALDSFSMARDLDTLRFRADSRINQIIRQVASKPDQSVQLVDMEQSLSKEGLLGQEIFYEHVHFTFQGNYLLARNLLDGVEKQLQERLGTPQGEVLSEEQCRERLAYTDYDHLMILRMVLGRLQLPPFTNQYDNEAQFAYWKDEVDRIDSQLRQDGAFVAPTKTYREAIRRSPDDVWLHLRYGFFQLDGNGDFEGARNSFKEVMRFGLVTPELWLGIGMTHYRQGDYEAAMTAFNKGLELEPDHWKLMTQLGFTLNLAGKSSEAIKWCRRAVELAPDRQEVYQNLGLVWMDNGQFEKARRCFEKVLELGGNMASDYVNLGLVLAAEGKPKEAEANYLRAHELDKGNFKANRELGALRLQEGNLREALYHFDKAIEVRADDIAIANNLAWLLATIPDEKLRDGPRAVALVQPLANATNYKNPTILSTLAAAYAEDGQFERAARIAELALTFSLSPDLAAQIRQRLDLYKRQQPYRSGEL